MLIMRHEQLLSMRTNEHVLFKDKKKIKVCLSVLGAAKTESRYNTRHKSFCSAMIGACTKRTASMNQPENNSLLLIKQFLA